MAVTKSEPAQSIKGSEQADIDVEKQNADTQDIAQDIEHVFVKDDPRRWSSKQKVCASWLCEQLDRIF